MDVDKLVGRLHDAVKMPARRSNRCWCFPPSSEPPEISYGVENGAMTLKQIAADTPMPNDLAELNDKFAELVDELDLDKSHRAAMFGLPPEKKWQIYCSKKRDQEEQSSNSFPEYYVEKLKSATGESLIGVVDDADHRLKLVNSLKTALRTQPMSFVTRFIELGGLESLVLILSSDKCLDEELQSSAIGSIKSLMNNSQGRAHVLAHKSCIDVIARSLCSRNTRAKISALEMLGAICLVPGGHRRVLQAISRLQAFARERTRFQTLMNDLSRDLPKSGGGDLEIAFKTAIMSFVNAALKYGAGSNHLEFRLHLRYELLMLGIQPAIERLRELENGSLERHLDFFEMVRIEDERALAKKLDTGHVDTKSASAMFELLRKKLSLTQSYSHFLSILFHLLQFPTGNSDTATLRWQLIDRIVQQICLQSKDGSDPDVAPLVIDVKKLTRQIANENDIKAVHEKIHQVEKEKEELSQRLAKKERECETKGEEKAQLSLTLSKMKEKLEKESLQLAEARNQLIQMENALREMQFLVESERGERVKLEHLVKTGSLPDDAKAGLTGLSSLRLPEIPSISSFAPPPPPPPAPPPAPAPPPPGSGLLPPTFGTPNSLSDASFDSLKKNVPKPSNPLKSFNWTKLPDSKLHGTVWREINEEKLYKQLDLDDFEANFSAYQPQEGSEIEMLTKASNKTKELSVIDGRRAQNCTILLSKLKMTNAELATAVLRMDEHDELARDMCEQLLKFVPQPEEIALLKEHEHEKSAMAKADRFLLEMSGIAHYEQRLRALFYKKKFHERTEECRPKVENVLEASKELLRSRKLKRVLELILAFGNYMNRGNRGNAGGFRISSLGKIGDTKSSKNRKCNLLHYLLDTVNSQFPELLQLESELPHLHSAAKVNLADLDGELSVLRSGIADIEKEMEFQRSRDDHFVRVMQDFLTVATYNFSELQDSHREMSEKFRRVTQMFGEENAQPDDFFGVFDLFLSSYLDANQENVRMKKMKEEQEKRAKLETKMKAEREQQKNRLAFRKTTGSATSTGEKGEFDDLISALRTGDVFGEDMAKLKSRNRRRPGHVIKIGDVSRERHDSTSET